MKYLITLLLGYTLVQAQQNQIDTLKYECKYLLTYQTDSTDIYSKKDEFFLLKIGNEKSLFVSENTLKRDSIRANLRQNNILLPDLSKIPKSAFSYKIVKEIHNNRVVFYDNFLRTYLSYAENMSLNWEFSHETDRIDKLECKIAYINYAGRRYRTWYATNIPIPEGPYKFYGLPGLIIKMQDIKDFYTFELISFKDVSSEKQTIVIENKNLNSKKVSKKDFIITFKNQSNNMGQQLSQMGITIGGDFIKQAQDKRKKANNPLELKPY